MHGAKKVTKHFGCKFGRSAIADDKEPSFRADAIERAPLTFRRTRVYLWTPTISTTTQKVSKQTSEDTQLLRTRIIHAPTECKATRFLATRRAIAVVNLNMPREHCDREQVETHISPAIDVSQDTGLPVDRDDLHDDPEGTVGLEMHSATAVETGS